jgi:hypothetical protein
VLHLSSTLAQSNRLVNLKTRAAILSSHGELKNWRCSCGTAKMPSTLRHNKGMNAYLSYIFYRCPILSSCSIYYYACLQPTYRSNTALSHWNSLEMLRQIDDEVPPVRGDAQEHHAALPLDLPSITQHTRMPSWSPSSAACHDELVTYKCHGKMRPSMRSVLNAPWR